MKRFIPMIFISLSTLLLIACSGGGSDGASSSPASSSSSMSSGNSTSSASSTASSAEASATSWYIRLVAEAPAYKTVKYGSRFGMLETDAQTAEAMSLVAREPRTGKSLDVVFENCDVNASIKCSTLFFPAADEASWSFAVTFEDGDDNDSNTYDDIILSFRGLYTTYRERSSYLDGFSQKNPLLQKMKIVDMESGLQIPLLDTNGSFTRYIYNQDGSKTRRFTWILQSDAVSPSPTTVIRAAASQAITMHIIPHEKSHFSDINLKQPPQ